MGAESAAVDFFPRLRVVKGKASEEIIPIRGDRLVMGRRSGEVILPDREVSGTHAELSRTPKGFVLRDLGSTNGTFLNGQQIKEELLHNGDELAIGRFLLIFEETRARDTAQSRSRFPLGLFDGREDFAWLGASIEDSCPAGFEADGTSLLELSASTVELRLPAQSAVQLEMVGGPEKGKIIPLTRGNVVLGRYGTDIVLKDQDVSRRHTIIDVFGRDQIFLRDLGSTNGCFVNGTRVDFCKLQSGDTIVLGRSVMQLVVRDPG